MYLYFFLYLFSCLDRNELLRNVKKVTVDGLITSGMTMRSFNNSLLNEHVESIMFSEFNNEEGKVTSE